MRILIVANGLRSGGKERQVLEIIKGLSSREDIEVILVIMNRDIFYDDIYNVNIPIEIVERKDKSAITVLRSFYKLCIKYKPEIIHTWDYLSTLYATPVARILRIKLLNGAIRFADFYFKPYGKLWMITKFVFPLSDKIVANSKAGLKSLNLDKKGVCIYNGFDYKRVNVLIEPERIKSDFNIKEKYIVGMVAKFKPDKDFESLIEAATIVIQKFDDVAFVLVGDGPKFEKIKNSAIDIPQIKLLGQQKNVENIINVFDICVLSTYTEGISNSIMEYMALAKPVIATDGGGTKELVLDRETGYLVNKESPHEIADRIIYLLNKPGIGKKMGFCGQERIRDCFSLKKMTDSYFNLYSEILKK